ncbi:uncharacterized protein (TIGR02099 family) [Trinickia symbiotica]|uniref:DUF3971 domain-containing protein n=1 Tax=Trinickia symbiotica TaxID=863227 RepID=A0A2N7WYJ3_9BURK|nr:AsmA-like C-terminal region-containing protein [Trinickia symbiotica]PMS34470.1 DUF3971 domain-containing protein [Trinickia symbiotica]PPK43201.1 uncharacterized protein (TIGR02099 family) [Trinickia symbiotica]
MSDSKESAASTIAGQSLHDHRFLRRALKIALAFAITVYFVAAAAFLGLRYLLLPRIDDFRPRIEQAVSATIHAELRIEKLAPHWSGLEPGVDVTGLTIRDRDGNLALSVPHAMATISWRSLARGKPALASLVVDGPDLLAARAADGSLTVAGVQVPTTHKGNDTTFTNWLLSQEAIVLRGGKLRWRDGVRKAPELALHDIRAAIVNKGFEHYLALQAPAEGTVLKGPLDFRARFRHRPLGERGRPQNWTGETYISTGPVDLPMLARYVQTPIALYAGRIDNAIWADFSGGHILAASGTLQGYDIALRVRPTHPQLHVPVAQFGWAAEIEPQRDYRLRLSNLHAELGQPPLADGTPVTRTLSFSTLVGRYRPASVEHGQLMSVRGDRVDLGVLAEFSRALPVPERFLDELVRFDPRGLIANYAIEAERARPENALAASEQRVTGTAPIVRYRVKGDLEGISIAAQEPPPGLSPAGHPRVGLPGFENIWGTIDADETHGAVSVDTVNATMTLPGEFDDPRLAFDRLRGRGQWTVTPAPGEPQKAFAVTVPELSFENADTAGTVVANYRNPGHGRGSLDLTANISRAKVPAISRYLPTSVGEHTRHYLGHGLQDGIARNATIEIHGGLDKFPYSRDPHAGIFRIVAPFSGGKFDPSPYPPKKLRNGEPDVWPALEGIDGVFTLRENLLRFDIDKGHYKRIALERVNGRIADLGNHGSSLVIDGRARGPLADLLDYLNNSAAGSLTDHVGDTVSASGPATLDLQLTVPRTQMPHVSVVGTVGLRGNTLARAQWPPLEKLTGGVRFTEHALSLERIAGRWLGGEFKAGGGLAANGSYGFDISGQIAADSARDFDRNGTAGKLLDRLHGAAPYVLDIRGRKGALPEVSAHSDLTGLALDLPAPLGKPVGTPMPFSFSVKPEPAIAEDKGSPLARADLALGPVTASYLVRHGAVHPDALGALSVVRGAIGIGEPARLPSEGVSAAADLQSFDADAWRTLVTELRQSRDTAGPREARANPADGNDSRGRSGGASNIASSSEFAPSRFDLRFGTLKLLEREWANVHIDAEESGRDWQARIASDQLTGDLNWRPGATSSDGGQLKAHFAKAEIPVAVGHALVGQLSTPSARHMPAIDLTIDDFVVRGHKLGQLALAAHNLDEDGVPVWQVDKFDITSAAAHLAATANWRTAPRLGANVAANTPRRTAIDFKLDISDAGALLDQLGLPRTVKAGKGSLTGSIGWRGEPTAIDYPTLWGHMSVDLQHGQILKVDPGVAKLLGVLSLQSLQRVITLNFRDVIGEGLPFHSVTGTGHITDGIARTDDFRIVTAPARADLSGSVNLAAETQNLHVAVTPTLNAGSAVIAATVVNPLLGLGALVANLALSQSIAHAFATQYAITGSWSHPRVERFTGDRGKMVAPAEATGNTGN